MKLQKMRFLLLENFYNLDFDKIINISLSLYNVYTIFKK